MKEKKEKKTAHLKLLSVTCCLRRHFLFIGKRIAAWAYCRMVMESGFESKSDTAELKLERALSIQACHMNKRVEKTAFKRSIDSQIIRN